jgi:hypothetical protein
MKKTHLLILLLVSVGWNIYSGYQQYNLNKQQINTNLVNKNLFQKNENLITNLKNLLSLNYTAILETKNIELIKLLNSGDKVVLYITEKNCASCIQESLNYLEILSTKIGKDKLVLLGNFKIKEDFEKFASYNSSFIGNSIYFNNAEFTKEVHNNPTVFISGKNLKIQALFIPNIYPQYSETYFINLPEYFK